MADVYYTEDHEWLRVEGDIATVGITDYAQEQLGDLVFVELPEVGRALKKGDTAVVVESVKAASDVYAPADGEITAVNDAYLRRGDLAVTVLPRGTAWFDTGTFEGLMDASQFVHVVEARQGYKIGCLEEIAWRAGWIDDAQFARLGDALLKSGYGTYIHTCLARGRNGA